MTTNVAYTLNEGSDPWGRHHTYHIKLETLTYAAYLPARYKAENMNAKAE